MPSPLFISEEEIRCAGPGNALAVCWRQWRAERALAKRGVHFRSTDLNKVAASYAAMTAAEFDAVNGRQDWANWRTIPRSLNGNVPNRPLRIVDLGCGPGNSTRVLAWWAPAGSHITGFEIAEPLLAVARRRKFLNRIGQVACVEFVYQSLTTSLRVSDGSRISDQSVDVINASGVVGHHFNPESVVPLIQEVTRLLRIGGIAMLDVGPTLPECDLTSAMNKNGFCKIGRCRSWFLDPTGQVVYRR